MSYLCKTIYYHEKHITDTFYYSERQNALFIKAGQFNHFDIGLYFKGLEHCEK